MNRSSARGVVDPGIQAGPGAGAIPRARMTSCKRVEYSGRVQGVGFRFTAERLAAGFPVRGYVRNMPDGSVELVAEGDSEAVDAFLRALAERMGPCIDSWRIADAGPSGERRFRIRY